MRITRTREDANLYSKLLSTHVPKKHVDLIAAVRGAICRVRLSLQVAPVSSSAHAGERFSACPPWLLKSTVAHPKAMDFSKENLDHLWTTLTGMHCGTPTWLRAYHLFVVLTSILPSSAPPLRCVCPHTPLSVSSEQCCQQSNTSRAIAASQHEHYLLGASHRRLLRP